MRIVVGFKDVFAFILNPSTNELLLIPLEGCLGAREHIASRALNRHLGRGVDVSDHGRVDHLLVGLQDVSDPVFALKSSVLLILRRKFFIAIPFDNRPE
jgi:hypothetical protein